MAELDVSEQSAVIALRLLGRFAVSVDGQPPLRFSARKSCALLAYLALQPDRRADRERLATLLWGDRSDELARQNLRQCLVSLRRDLPPAASNLLAIDSHSVGLRSRHLSVDVHELAALADATDLCRLERAVDLYRGPFLADLSIETEAFEEWVRAERARIEAIAARIFVACAERADTAGHGPHAIKAAQHLTTLDPFCEDWQRAALRIYARHLGRDAAMVHANHLVALIRTELGVDVEPATFAVIEDIKRGAFVSVTSSAIVNLEGSGDAPSARPAADRPVARVRPYWRVRAASFAASTAMLCVLGFWLAVGNSGIAVAPPGGRIADARSDRSAGDLSWNSPIPRFYAPTSMAALAARAVTPIMVWPFDVVFGNSAADKSIADAISDDLITSLSRFPSLRVIARQTAFAYPRSADAATIGSELGVRYVVEGSVRTKENVLRINVQLVDVRTRLQVWGDSFERNHAHRAEIQDEVVARLARELDVEVTSAQSRRSAHEQAGDPAVAELVAKGLMAQYRGQAEDLNKARAYYEGALRREPDLVPALVGVAVPDITGSSNFIVDSTTSLARASRFLSRAQELDPDSARVHYWIGLLHKARGDYVGSLRSLNHAIELNPSFTPAYAHAGGVLTLMGRANEAMEPISYAMRLSPQDPTMGGWALNAGMAEIEVGHDWAALEWFRRSASLVPNSPNVHRCLSAVYALLGDDENAMRHLAEFKRLGVGATTQRAQDLRMIADGAGPRRLMQGLRKAYALGS